MDSMKAGPGICGSGAQKPKPKWSGKNPICSFFKKETYLGNYSKNTNYSNWKNPTYLKICPGMCHCMSATRTCHTTWTLFVGFAWATRVLEELHLQRQPQNVMLEANPRFFLELEALRNGAVRPCDILRENCV